MKFVMKLYLLYKYANLMETHSFKRYVYNGILFGKCQVDDS